MILDTHCHIHFKGLKDDYDSIVKRSRDRGVIFNLVGTQKDTSASAVAAAMENDDMYASIGTHPNHVFPTHIAEEESSFKSREEFFDEEYYEELYQRAPDKIIGVGECGIDFYHIPTEDEVPFETVLKKQKEVFEAHYRFAKKHDLPLVIHVRDPKDLSLYPSAHEELLKMLESFGEQIRATVHCFSGNWSQAQRYLELGCHLGFTGVITFPPKKTKPQEQESLLEVVQKVPLDRILVETDAPYLAPQKYRGKRSEPWMCQEQILFIAKLRGISAEELEDRIFENSKKLFSKVKG